MNGQPNPVKQLADALHDCVEPPGRKERTERLADALQACLNEAVKTGARETAHQAVREVALEAAFEAARETAREAAHQAAQEVKRELEPRLDRQDATLRLIWKQVKGNGRLPIDD